MRIDIELIGAEIYFYYFVVFKSEINDMRIDSNY